MARCAHVPREQGDDRTVALTTLRALFCALTLTAARGIESRTGITGAELFLPQAAPCRRTAVDQRAGGADATPPGHGFIGRGPAGDCGAGGERACL